VDPELGNLGFKVLLKLILEIKETKKEKKVL